MDEPVCRFLTYRESGHCRILDLASCPDDEASAAQCAEFAEVCERVAWDEQARVIVLCFAGEMAETAARDPLLRSSVVEQTAGLRQPVIAAIRGNATGVGLELALACDIRIASEQARFGLPRIREGRMPSHGGTQRLPRLIGQSRAMEMVLTGRLLDASEALKAGLVHRTAPPDEVVPSAMEMASQMAAQSPLSLSYAKEALYGGTDLALDQGLKLELDLYLLLFSTSDRPEGITAFKEKRKPDFRGI